MGHQLKKMSLALMALGMAGTAAAGGYTPPPMVPTGIPVTLPHTDSQWDIGVEAVWMRPGTTEDLYLQRGSVQSSTADFPGFVVGFDHDGVRPSFEWGFKLEGSYHFAGSGTNIHLNWLRVHGTDDDNTVCTGGLTPFISSTDGTQCSPVFGPLGVSNFVDGLVKGSYGFVLDGVPPGGNAFVDDEALSVFAKHRFDFDVVNLVFGQHVDFGQYLDVNFDMGVQYARVDHEYEVSISQTQTGETPTDGSTLSYTATFTDFTDSRVRGFGPTFGADAAYEIGNGFSAVLHSRVALLYASRKLDEELLFTETQVIVNEVTPPDAEAIAFDRSVVGRADYDSDHVLVPTVEVALAGRFTHDMGDDAAVSVEAGWRHVYVNHGARLAGYGLDGERLVSHAPTTLGGPYIGVKYIG